MVDVLFVIVFVFCFITVITYSAVTVLSLKSSLHIKEQKNRKVKYSRNMAHNVSPNLILAKLSENKVRKRDRDVNRT